MWQKYNANPRGKSVGDCTIRALSKALGQTWDRTFWELCDVAYELCDMPSANSVWGEYLRRRGFKRRIIPDNCPQCYTVADFIREHPRGTYIVALSGHVVCVINGVLFDTWDSRLEIPIYYWEE